MSDEFERAGALPSLDGGTESQDSGAPVGATKGKSNIRLALFVVFALVAIGFVVSGLVLYVKNRPKKAPAPAETRVMADPTKILNKSVDAVSIEDTKSKIKKEAEASELEDSGSTSDDYREAALRAAGSRPAAGDGPGRAAGPATAQNGRSANARQGQGGGDLAPVEPVKTRRARQLEDDVMFGGTKPAPADAGGTPRHATAPAAPQEQDPFARLSSILNPPAQQASLMGAGPAVPGQPVGEKSGLEAQLTPTTLEARRATRLGNLDFLLKKDTVIPCALRTGIDTTLASFPVCQVTNDVYSANGKTVLVERGATIHGESRAKLEQGQSRIFALWTRIDNPSGVVAQLDSPGADQMGYGGLPADVDTHFWERYSGAIMLSMIQDGLAAALKSDGNGGTTVQIGNTSGTVQNMAAESLKSTINIPPTGRVKPARVITIVIARDISFESIFKIIQ